MDIKFRKASSIVQLRNVTKLAAFLMYMSVIVQSETSSKIIQTSSGAVRGVVVSTLHSEVDAYLGIPYALPPVGERRFRRPVPIPSWSNIYNATMKPSPCYQNITVDTYYYPKKENLTEDCLYLNVWVPRSLTENSKPKGIMVFIHGGAFNSGSTDMDSYDGAILASFGEIIIASINFRIGAFGYFTASIEGASGNMALYDQLLALKWINENAGAFGGDKSQITLFGQSAGGSTVSALLLSPYAQNLFKRGIVESGSALTPAFVDSPKTQAIMSNTIAVLTGCAKDRTNITTDPESVVSCLRSLPASQISKAEGMMKATSSMTFFPIYGDEIIPIETSEALKRQQFESKEVLIGVNADEGPFLLAAAFPEYFGRDGFDGVERFSKSFVYLIISAISKRLGGPNGKDVADFYFKRSKTRDYRKIMSDVIGDFLVSCSAILFADLYSINAENVYFYIFSHISSLKPTADWMGSTHGAEIPYVFGLPLRKEFNYTEEEEKELSRRIMSRFTTFAKTGNPDVPNGLRWPKYSYEYPAYLELSQEEKIKLRPNERCEFWRDTFRANIDSVKHVKYTTDSFSKDPVSDSSILQNSLSPYILVLVCNICYFNYT